MVSDKPVISQDGNTISDRPILSTATPDEDALSLFNALKHIQTLSNIMSNLIVETSEDGIIIVKENNKVIMTLTSSNGGSVKVTTGNYIDHTNVKRGQ